MKKLYVIVMTGVLIVMLSSAIEKVNKSAGPPSCHAGEPPGRLNCTECHNDGILNSGTAEVLLDLGGADTDYVAGKTYTITVSVSKPGLKRAGFQCIALRDDDDKTSPGKVIVTDAVRTQVLDKNTPHSGGCLDEERVWIEHTYQGNSSDSTGISRWTYQWQAPSAPAGSITFYLGALEANNDLAETGDQVYTLKKTIAGLPVGISETPLPDEFSIYPQPSGEEINISYKNNKPRQVTLYSPDGRRISTWKSFASPQRKTISVRLNDPARGTYILDIQTGNTTHTYRKIFVQ